MNNFGERVPADFPSDAQRHREVIAAPFLWPHNAALIPREPLRGRGNYQSRPA